MIYVDRLRAREHPHELYIYDTGHSSFDIAERVRQRGIVLDFLARTVTGIEPLPRVEEVAAEVRAGPGYTSVGSPDTVAVAG
jgi:hypothetical protein